MPELPEVETVRRGLEPVLVGRRFEHVVLNRPDLRIPFPEGFAETIAGQRVQAVGRRSKYLLLQLENHQNIVIHLGMSGRVVVYPNRRNRQETHDHVCFYLEDGKEIVFNDPRRFGLMTLVSETELPTHSLFAALGPEPLTDHFTADTLLKAFRGKKAPVKNLIMDNHVVVGVGNIYAAESLFRAGISPQRPAGKVTPKEAGILAAVIKDVLNAALESGGSTLRDYVRSSGDPGYFQHHFAVYDREGKPCERCKGTIIRFKQAGRSSFACDSCQK